MWEEGSGIIIASVIV